MATLNVPDDHLKSLREVLCLAQSDALHSGRDAAVFDAERIQSLINQIDQHRPLGVNGKHGDRHTDTCGCDDKPERTKAATITARLVLDTTDFDAALARAREALAELYATPLGVKVNEGAGFRYIRS